MRWIMGLGLVALLRGVWSALRSGRARGGQVPPPPVGLSYPPPLEREAWWSRLLWGAIDRVLLDRLMVGERTPPAPGPGALQRRATFVGHPSAVSAPLVSWVDPQVPPTVVEVGDVLWDGTPVVRTWVRVGGSGTVWRYTGALHAVTDLIVHESSG